MKSLLLGTFYIWGFQSFIKTIDLAYEQMQHPRKRPSFQSGAILKQILDTAIDFCLILRNEIGLKKFIWLSYTRKSALNVLYQNYCELILQLSVFSDLLSVFLHTAYFLYVQLNFYSKRICFRIKQKATCNHWFW